MLDEIERRTGQRPAELLADGGYNAHERPSPSGRLGADALGARRGFDSRPRSCRDDHWDARGTVRQCCSRTFDAQCVPASVGVFEVRGQGRCGWIDGDGGLPSRRRSIGVGDPDTPVGAVAVVDETLR